MWVIWSSPLSIPRKIKEPNSYALPTLQYYMWTTDWSINISRELDRLTRKIIRECHDKHKHESTQLLYLPPEEGGKGLIEIEALYKHTKIKVAHYLNTSEDEHFKLVKSFQKRKEDRSLKSVFKDSERYIEELQLDCQFNDGATLTGQADQVVMVKNPKTSKKSYEKRPSRREDHGTALGWKICNSALERPGNSACVISDIQGMEEHPRYIPVGGHVH